MYPSYASLRATVDNDLPELDALASLLADFRGFGWTFLPSAAASPIRAASAGPQFRNVTPPAGVASSGWWVSTKIGPCQAPPYGSSTR
jgi:hypothetical protein